MYTIQPALDYDFSLRTRHAAAAKSLSLGTEKSLSGRHCCHEACSALWRRAEDPYGSHGNLIASRLLVSSFPGLCPPTLSVEETSYLPM